MPTSTTQACVISSLNASFFSDYVTKSIFPRSSELFELCFEALSERIVCCQSGEQFLQEVCFLLLNALFFFDGFGRSIGGSRGSTRGRSTPTSLHTGRASALLRGGCFGDIPLGKLAAARAADHSGGPIACVRALRAFDFFLLSPLWA